MSPIESQIAEYDARSGLLANSIGSKQEEVDKYTAAALEPKKNTLSDALISAVIQVLPGLLGYAASGKAGGAIGLQAGLGAGTAYENILKDRYDTNVKKNALLADKSEKSLLAEQAAKKALETRTLNLEEKGIFFDKAEAGRNARSASRTSNDNQLNAGLIAALTGKKDAPVDDATLQQSDQSVETPESSTNAIEDAFQRAGLTEEQAEILMSNKSIRAAVKDTQTIAKNKQQLAEGDQSIIQSKAETQKALTETIQLERTLEAGKRFEIIAKEGITLPNSGALIEPGPRAYKGGTKESEADIRNLSAYSSAYDNAMRQILEISKIVSSKNAAQRFASSDARRLPDQLADSLAILEALSQPGNKAPNEQSIKRAREKVNSLKIGSFLSNIGEQATALPFDLIPSFQDELQTLAGSITGKFATDLDVDYGYKFSAPKTAAKNEYQRFNDDSSIVRYGTDASGKRVKVTVDPETNEAISVEEVE